MGPVNSTRPQLPISTPSLPFHVAMPERMHRVSFKLRSVKFLVLLVPPVPPSLFLVPLTIIASTASALRFAAAFIVKVRVTLYLLNIETMSSTVLLYLWNQWNHDFHCSTVFVEPNQWNHEFHWYTEVG